MSKLLGAIEFIKHKIYLIELREQTSEINLQDKIGP